MRINPRESRERDSPSYENTYSLQAPSQSPTRLSPVPDGVISPDGFENGGTGCLLSEKGESVGIPATETLSSVGIELGLGDSVGLRLGFGDPVGLRLGLGDSVGMRLGYEE